MKKVIFFIFLNNLLFSQSVDSAHYFYEIGISSRSKRLHNFQKSLSFTKTDSEFKVDILNEISKENRKGKNFKMAVEKARSALDVSKKINCELCISRSYSHIAGIYYEWDSLTIALENYQMSKRFLPKDSTSLFASLYNNIGICNRDLQKFDLAIQYLEKAAKYFKSEGSLKNSLAVKLNICFTKIDIGETKNVSSELDSIIIISEKHDWDNLLYKALNAKVELIAISNNIPELTFLVDSISSLEHIDFIKSLNENSVKYETEIKENENRYLKGISKKQKWTIIGLISSLFLLTLGAFFYLRNQMLKNKLREANLTIAKQSALSAERTRIASEMHDDLGGGLTTIKFLSQKVLRKSKDEIIKTQVKKIVKQSETLVNNMSEIIWAMNAGFDTLTSLISYSRRYAHEYLEAHDIGIDFKVAGVATKIKLSGTERRNIFLVIKEALHNAVKHADSDKISIRYEVTENLKIIIQDNGLGISESNDLGNGLKNMKNRMENIGGSFSQKNNEGLLIELTFPNLTKENAEKPQLPS